MLLQNFIVNSPQLVSVVTYVVEKWLQGDVIVGWINAATGKGGVDDYFLSGTAAESFSRQLSRIYLIGIVAIDL
jgi:hypothetical protein